MNYLGCRSLNLFLNLEGYVKQQLKFRLNFVPVDLQMGSSAGLWLTLHRYSHFTRTFLEAIDQDGQISVPSAKNTMSLAMKLDLASVQPTLETGLTVHA